MLRKGTHFIGDTVENKTYDQIRIQLTRPPWKPGERFGLTLVEIYSVDASAPAKFGAFKTRSIDTKVSTTNVFKPDGLVKRVSTEIDARPKTQTAGLALSQEVKRGKRVLPSLSRPAPGPAPGTHSPADATKLQHALSQKAPATTSAAFATAAAKRVALVKSPGAAAAAAAAPTTTNLGSVLNIANDDGDDGLSEYEKKRLRNIRENDAKIAELGLLKSPPQPPVQRPKKPRPAGGPAPNADRQRKRLRGDDSGAAAPAAAASAAVAAATPQPRRRSSSQKRPVGLDMPMKQIMRGCTFVLSGFQNPLRSEIRSKAIELGGWYVKAAA
jgi:hypothetical protein